MVATPPPCSCRVKPSITAIGTTDVVGDSGSLQGPLMPTECMITVHPHRRRRFRHPSRQFLQQQNHQPRSNTKRSSSHNKEALRRHDRTRDNVPIVVNNNQHATRTRRKLLPHRPQRHLHLSQTPPPPNPRKNATTTTTTKRIDSSMLGGANKYPKMRSIPSLWIPWSA